MICWEHIQDAVKRPQLSCKLFCVTHGAKRLYTWAQSPDEAVAKAMRHWGYRARSITVERRRVLEKHLSHLTHEQLLRIREALRNVKKEG